MPDLPFGATDSLSADRWFASLTESLEELLGAQGAQAVLSRALDDAQRTWPQLSRVGLKREGFDLSILFSTYPGPRGKGYSVEAAVALRGLVDSLHLLLECLLGRQLASELIPWYAAQPESRDDQQDDTHFGDCA